MPEFNNRAGNAGTGQGTVVRLQPLDHPHLGSTYHGSVQEAHEAAKTQSEHYGGFKYDVHQDGKKVVAGGLAYGVEKTKQAQAYNRAKKK